MANISIHSVIAVLLITLWFTQSVVHSQNLRTGNVESPQQGVEIRFDKGEGPRNATGAIVVQAKDGGLLIETNIGELIPLQPNEILDRVNLDEPPTAATFDEMESLLLSEFPEDFSCYRTDHFVFCYNTSQAYVKWNASLYERLYRGFHRYWQTRRVSLNEPKYPMVALVFDGRDSYLNYATAELGNAAESMIGYYAIMNNRVVTFDLTGADGLTANQRNISSAEVINRILSQPQSERTVATIVHEAVHQISYNCGLQVRLGANPLWVSEGLATFFEAPDLKSKSGWGGIGNVNLHSYRNFANTFASRPPDNLSRIIMSDDLLRNPTTATQAYAESWALTYYLMRTKKQQYADYLKQLREKQPLSEETPQQRLDTFREHFGDIETFETNFVKYLKLLQP